MTASPELTYIAAPLRPLAIEVGALLLDPENARAHDRPSIDAIKVSLVTFTQRKPIVVRREPGTDRLVCVEAGNGTLTAARELGWTHVACVVVEESEAHGKAYALADNRTAELSTWATTAAAVAVQVINDLPQINFAALGLDTAWLDSIKVETISPPDLPGDGGDGGDTKSTEHLDGVPEVVPAVTKIGDVVVLGPHTLHCSDCMTVLRSLPDNSVDAIVTDPPYGLSPDGRARTWDDIEALRQAGKKGPKSGFLGKAWDAGVPGPTWAAECLRVLKPGGHIVAFSATRTQHRLACALEDVGFEIRDVISWLQWQGMPKSQDVSKIIDKNAGATREVVGSRRVDADSKATELGVSSYAVEVTAPATDDAKRWVGWGSGLKPAAEPAILARKPLEAGLTIAANLIKWGTGAINLDACRIAEGDLAWPGPQVPLHPVTQGLTSGSGLQGPRTEASTFAPHDGGRWPANVYAAPKPATSERSAGEAGRMNTHPTVKPVKLIRWLVQLVTPPGGTVVDPFGGSGTVLPAAHGLDCSVVVVEVDPGYCDIIRARGVALGLEAVEQPRTEPEPPESAPALDDDGAVLDF